MSSLVWPERPLGRPGAHGRRAGAGLSRRRAVHSEALMAEDEAQHGMAVEAPDRQLAHGRAEEEARSEAAARPAGGAAARLGVGHSSKRSRGACGMATTPGAERRELDGKEQRGKWAFPSRRSYDAKRIRVHGLSAHVGGTRSASRRRHGREPWARWQGSVRNRERRLVRT
jgi:hypothetical protein